MGASAGELWWRRGRWRTQCRRIFWRTPATASGGSTFRICLFLRMQGFLHQQSGSPPCHALAPVVLVLVLVLVLVPEQCRSHRQVRSHCFPDRRNTQPARVFLGLSPARIDDRRNWGSWAAAAADAPPCAAAKAWTRQVGPAATAVWRHRVERSEEVAGLCCRWC